MMNEPSFIIQQLRAYTKKHPYNGVFENELRKEMEEIERQLYRECIAKDPSFNKIPPFFFKKPVNNQIQGLLTKESKRIFTEDKSKKVLSSRDLDNLWEQLLNHSTPPVAINDEKINYQDFIKATQCLNSELVSEYCSPCLFMKFKKDELGRISIPSYFNYILRKLSLIQSKISLSRHDSDADNYLTESDLRNFIKECIKNFPCLKEMPKQFVDIYVTTAVRKFCFFLDVHKRDRVCIDDIVASPVLVELNELLSEDLVEPTLNENWFSLDSIQSVHVLFKQLNLTMSGTLSRNEIRGFNNNCLTMTFIDRFLQEYGTKKGQLEYKTFVNFIIAYDNKNTPQSIEFFWPILDVDKKGYLTPFTINFFFREISKKLQKNNAEVANVKDVNEEIFAMVMPSGNPLHITLQDLINCRCGGTVISILIDVDAFWAYDNRESLSQQNQ